MTSFLTQLMANKYLYLFMVSMLPVVELRGGMPIGAAMDLPFWHVYIICVAGNLLPVPLLIKFSKTILFYLAQKQILGNFFRRIIQKANAKALTIGRYELLGLCLFVAIPFPGTGAWTGAFIATILQLRLIPAFLAITLGVLLCGLIMGVLSYGLVEIFGLIVL